MKTTIYIQRYFLLSIKKKKKNHVREMLKCVKIGPYVEIKQPLK